MRQAIQNVVDQVVAKFPVRRIILFGSRASGKAAVHSDVDLLIILSYRGSAARKAAQIWRAIETNLPLDLLVRTPAELEKRIKAGDSFLIELVQKGQTLYEAPDAGMGAKGRRRLRKRAA